MDHKDIDWYLRRIDYLGGFMTEERIAVLRRMAQDRTRYMTICLENIFHPQNASSLVRHCEAFGVQDIHTVQALCRFSPNVRIVRGTDKWVDIHRYGDTAEAMAVLKSKGYRIVATTPGGGNFSPESFDVAKSPFALIFGTEHEGISSEVEAAADEFITIPMVGCVESLNVSASAAILLYTLHRRLRSENLQWQIPEGDRVEILFRWMMESLRDSERILSRFKG